MKNIKLIFTFLIVATLVLVTSCGDVDENANAKKAALLSILQQNEDLSTLVSAIQLTGLESTLNDLNGNYTFFAPSNTAFSNFLTEKGFASIDAVPSNVLKEILLNHVVGQKITLDNLTPSGYLKTLAHGNASATNTLSMYVQKSDNMIILNGLTHVSIGDIQASNGLIHKVDKVIDLPTIVTHVVANPQFSSLFSALTRPDNGNYFKDLLSGSDFAPYTVFAPVNGGFTNLYTDLDTTLAEIPLADLTDILSYHVVAPANVLGSTLQNNQVVTTFINEDVTIRIGGGNFRIEDSNTRLANFTLNDIQCSNGVIHAIDNVLLPNLD